MGSRLLQTRLGSGPAPLIWHAAFLHLTAIAARRLDRAIVEPNEPNSSRIQSPIDSGEYRSTSLMLTEEDTEHQSFLRLWVKPNAGLSFSRRFMAVAKRAQRSVP
jgi:hypothetical protein